MNKCMITALAITIAASAPHANAGLFSALRDKVTGNEAVEEQQPATAATPAAAPTTQKAGQPSGAKTGKPTPAQPTPDPEQIKAGAKKLQKQLSWEAVPANIFQEYSGKWKGDLWVYSVQGSLEQHNSVQVECTLQGDGSMKMETFYFDRISKLWTTAESATYKVASSDTVKVEIKRPNGETARQTGHYNDQSLFLTADIKDGVEHYRERIDGNRYLVDGFGVYGSLKSKDQHIFIGRLQRQR